MADEKQQTIQEEAGLGPEWVPIDAPPIIPGVASPIVDGSSRYLQGSLPPQSQHDASFVGTAYKSDRTPSVALMPLAINGNPSSNAAIQSTSGAVVAATPPTSSGGIGSVAFTAPVEAIITGSPIGPPGGTINWAWATEDASTVFSGPNAGVVGFDVSFVSGGTSNTLSAVGGTPSVVAEWALFSGFSAGVQITNPTGWTSLNNAVGQVSAKQLSGSAVSVTQSLGSSQHWVAALVYFNGNLPTFVQNANVGINGTVATVSFPSNTVAGNTVIVVVQTSVPPPLGSNVGLSVSDSQGNPINAVAFAFTAGDNIIGSGSQTAVYVIQNVLAAAETITLRLSRSVAGEMTILEVAPPPALAAVPRFRALPAVNLSVSGPGGVISNLLHTNLNGGTNASATTFWRGDDTWSAVTFPNLSGNISTSQMNSGVSASASTFWRGDGTWSAIGEFAVVDNTTAVANIGSTILTTPTAAGLYRVTGVVIVNRVASTSSTLPNLILSWTDQDNSTVQSATFVATNPSANSLTTMYQIDAIMSVKASTNITYQTGDSLAYASSGVTSMRYSVRLRTEVL